MAGNGREMAGRWPDIAGKWPDSVRVANRIDTRVRGANVSDAEGGWVFRFVRPMDEIDGVPERGSGEAAFLLATFVTRTDKTRQATMQAPARRQRS